MSTPPDRHAVADLAPESVPLFLNERVDTPTLRADLLQHALLNHRPGLFANLMAAAGISALAYPELGHVLAAWFGLMSLTTALRWASGRVLHRARVRKLPTADGLVCAAELVFQGGYVVSPLLWAGLAIWGLPQMQLPTLFALIVVLAALVGGATGVLAPLRRLGQVYMFLLLVPASVCLLTLDPPQWVLSVLGVLFAGVALISHRHNHDLLRRALLLQRRNDYLLQRLSESNAAISTANAELESRVEARTAELSEVSQRDMLTGLLNRRGLLQMLQQGEPATADPQAAGLALLFVDIDHFKQVNDGLGHEAGDRVLREVATRLAAVVPAGARIGRWGGDEFVLAWPGQARTEAELSALAVRLRECLAPPILIGAERLQLGATIGYALRQAQETGAELIAAADLATADAKRRGRGLVAAFEPALAAVQQRRLQVVGGLQTATDDGSLWVAYQPIVCASSGSVASAEALLRWDSPRLGAVSPAEFIPVAEDSERILQLGDWVLRRALLDLARMPSAQLGEISVNVSMRQLAGDGLYASVCEALSASGVQPSRLVLEVTESIFEERSSERTLKALNALTQLGVRIHLDDFGAGYSSLGNLHAFPLSAVKIDRSFVSRLDDHACAIIEATVLIARRFGLQVIAEGVETEAQAAQLKSMQVDRFQGYLYGRPNAGLDWLQAANAST